MYRTRFLVMSNYCSFGRSLRIVVFSEVLPNQYMSSTPITSHDKHESQCKERYIRLCIVVVIHTKGSTRREE